MKGQPRLSRIVHHGSVEAHGFVVDGLLGEPMASSRVLAAWVPGAMVYAVDEGWLVCLPSRPRVRTDRSPGLPLALISTHLVGFPATSAEAAALAPNSPSLIRMRGGRLRVTPLRELAVVDPSGWLDLDAHRAVTCDSLGAPPEPASPSIPEAPQFEARKRLKAVPAQAPAAEDVLRTIVETHAQAQGAPPASNAGSALRRLWSWLSTNLRGLARRVTPPTRAASGRVPGRLRARRGPVEHLAAWLNARLNRAVLFLDLAQVIGRRQARYLARMMEMFQRGNMDDALRHALPLGRPGDEPAAPALGVPTPRADLSIRPGMVPAGRVIGGRDLYQDLEATYRTAFERLDARGEVEKAAFVLAELLRAHEEAVSYLERHGRLSLAAEMAEARGLSAGLVVRLWYLAGDRKRAVTIARREGVFADVIVRLERSGKTTEANDLRLLWADLLASAGDFAAAVDAVSSVPEGQRLAKEWIDRGIEQGGPVGARLLVRKLSMVPEAFDDVRDRAVALLENDDPEGRGTRHTFAMALRDRDPTPGVRTLARVALRAALRDSTTAGVRLSPSEYRDLVALTDDGALRADAPPLPLPPRGQSLAELGTPLRLAIAPIDVGLLPVWDAALLPNGRMVLALGELGVRLLSPAGRVVAHFEAPAERLIVSDRGDRAIAMARRGEAWRLSRVDLVRRHAETWCDARIDAAAPDYDGATWFVATTDLLAIDATAARFESLSRIPDVCSPANVASTRLARSSSKLLLHVGDVGEQVWRFDLPSLTLRLREEVPGRAGSAPRYSRQVGISAEGAVAELNRPASDKAGASEIPSASAAAPISLRLIAGNGIASVTVGGAAEDPGEPTLTRDWVATWLRTPDRCRVLVLDTKHLRIRAEIQLARAQRVALRLGPEFLAVGDDMGRLLLLELEQGRLIRDHRT